jgi:hypothetical protein
MMSSAYSLAKFIYDLFLFLILPNKPVGSLEGLSKTIGYQTHNTLPHATLVSWPYMETTHLASSGSEGMKLCLYTNPMRQTYLRFWLELFGHRIHLFLHIFHILAGYLF